ncbi:hypothetical protein [Thermoflexibacter ruber]|uniref:DoxX protein n=1 Tax=Thermoflexibacter ruber TaxID=1003 RepID=A0A1I2IE56_9BACT|nr:hypothetical protein [Thermoflexibacter ruber]SFF40504.1 hypothetical protein SAMN04488541_103146 [Thermoflexibacter ruber]
MLPSSFKAVENTHAWAKIKKFGFYFLFSYYFLYAFPQVFDGIIPFVDGILGHYYSAQDSFVSFVGEAIFKLGYHEPNYNSGSGDQVFFYIRQVVFLLLALLSALIWFLIAKKYSSHNKLYEILRIYLRYFLGAILLSYGFAKVFPSQMPPLTPIQLTQPYGHFSPMGIAWAFMGSSPAFQVFTGVLEVLSGLLLLFRKTTTLGALLAVIVLMGVVVFNFCYDIPVKINSTNYLFIAVFLLLNARKSLVNLFFFHQETKPETSIELFMGKKQRITAIVFKYSYIAYLLFVFTTDAYSFYFDEVKQRSQHPLYGVYDVGIFIRNNDTIPMLKGDTSVWNKIVLSYPKVLSVRDMKDSLQRFPIIDFDSAKYAVKFLTNPSDTTHISTLYYHKSQGGQMELIGNVGRDSVFIKAYLIEQEKYLILNRGFHWISEKPFNK